MFLEEALWLKKQLDGLDLGRGDQVLDIGSSTRHFREAVQPYIDAEVFKPLHDRGVTVVHLDSKAAEGVDLVCDAGDFGAVADRFAAVVCSNLLEHVENPAAVATGAYNLVAPDGYLLLTAPRRYRIHADPIDTAYRPHWRELFGLVNDLGAERVTACIVTVYDRGKYTRREFWRRAFYRWQSSCLIVRKPVIRRLVSGAFGG